jgi:hypothetical protein
LLAPPCTVELLNMAKIAIDAAVLFDQLGTHTPEFFEDRIGHLTASAERIAQNAPAEWIPAIPSTAQPIQLVAEFFETALDVGVRHMSVIPG